MMNGYDERIMKSYDERISELEAEIDGVLLRCENRVLELRVMLDAVKGLKNASMKEEKKD